MYKVIDRDSPEILGRSSNNVFRGENQFQDALSVPLSLSF